VHAPCHMMLAPMVSVLAHLLALLVSGLGGHLLQCVVLFLLGLVPIFLLILHFLIATFSFFLALSFTLDNIVELIVKLEVSLESIEHTCHGHNLLVVGGFGPPHPPSLEAVALAGGKGHEGLVSHSCECPIEPVVVVAVYALLEVEAGDNKVGIEQEPNRVINGGNMGQQLRVISVKIAMDLVDVAINRCCKCPLVLKVLTQGLCCGKGVNGGKSHDDLVHKGCIFHTAESVLIAVGEQPCLSLNHE
jgi:hypothetical protein